MKSGEIYYWDFDEPELIIITEKIDGLIGIWRYDYSSYNYWNDTPIISESAIDETKMDGWEYIGELE